MQKDPSPLLGYNNNIRHKNRVFHVQTEDSGIRHPHVITHLFMDGGRILKSVKTSYAEHVGAEKMADVVSRLMKDQHKGMLIALRDGQFDQMLEDADSSSKSLAPPSTVVPSPSKVKSASTEAKAPSAGARPALMPPPLDSSPLEARAKKASSPPAGAAFEEEGPPTTRMSTVQVEEQTQALALDLDVEALERAASGMSAPFTPQNDLPPPPPNLFRAKEPGTGGAYRTLTPPPDEAARVRPPSRPPPAGVSPSRPPSRPPGPRVPSMRPDSRAEKEPLPPGATAARAATGRPPPVRPPNAPKPRTEPPAPRAPDARYAPARPAAIFGQSQPKRASIFGDDLISDKSLDEVILSYLAEDLEAAPEKKKK